MSASGRLAQLQHDAHSGRKHMADADIQIVKRGDAHCNNSGYVQTISADQKLSHSSTPTLAAGAVLGAEEGAASVGGGLWLLPSLVLGVELPIFLGAGVKW